MSQSKSALVVDKDGVRGTVEVVAQPIVNESSKVSVVLDNGQQIALPAGALVDQKDGTFFVPYSFAQQSAVQTGQGEGQLVIPVVEETLDVQKREVEIGRVRVTKKVHEREEIVDEPLMEEEVSVTRVDINHFVEGTVAVRYEGDTMVIPLLEEVLVTEKRLMLKAELHITKRQFETHKPQTVSLRTEEAIIERVDSSEQ